MVIPNYTNPSIVYSYKDQIKGGGKIKRENTRGHKSKYSLYCIEKIDAYSLYGIGCKDRKSVVNFIFAFYFSSLAV